MTTKTISFCLSTLLFLCLSCKSSKPENDTRKTNRNEARLEEMFARMDANKDGKLALSEVKGPLKEDFTKIDTDEDGFLSKEELEKAPKPNRNRPPRGGQQSPRNN